MQSFGKETFHGNSVYCQARESKEVFFHGGSKTSSCECFTERQQRLEPIWVPSFKITKQKDQQHWFGHTEVTSFEVIDSTPSLDWKKHCSGQLKSSLKTVKEDAELIMGPPICIQFVAFKRNLKENRTSLKFESILNA